MNSKPSPEALQAIKRRTDELLVKWIEDYEEVRTGGVVDELGAGGKAFRDMMKEGADVGRDQALEMIEELDFKPIHRVVKEDVLEHPSVSQRMDTETLESPITLDKASYEFALKMIKYGELMERHEAVLLRHQTDYSLLSLHNDMSNPEIPRSMRMDKNNDDSEMPRVHERTRALTKAEQARAKRWSTPLPDCIELYVQAKLRQGSGEGAKQGWSVGSPAYIKNMRVLKVMQDSLEVITGSPTTTMQDILPEEVSKFKEFLRYRYPKGYAGKVSIRELMRTSKTLPDTRRPSATTLIWLGSACKSFFKWAEENDYLLKSPWGNEPLEAGTRGAKPRGEWSPSSIKAFYELPYKYPERIKEKDTAWWLWSIGAYTGMRLNEICQLYRDDVMEVDGISCFRVTVNADRHQKVKTNQTRYVPIHSQLLEAGLMDMVRPTVTPPLPEGSPLFPDLWEEVSFSNEKRQPLQNTIGISHYKTSIRLNRLLKNLRSLEEDQSKTYVFHSLRHTVNGSLVRANIPDRVIQTIMGHEGANSMTSHYGKGLTPKELKPHLERLDYGFNLRDYL